MNQSMSFSVSVNVLLLFYLCILLGGLELPPFGRASSLRTLWINLARRIPLP